jgi:hypothetical protein
LGGFAKVCRFKFRKAASCKQPVKTPKQFEMKIILLFLTTICLINYSHGQVTKHNWLVGGTDSKIYSYFYL